MCVQSATRLRLALLRPFLIVDVAAPDEHEAQRPCPS